MTSQLHAADPGQKAPLFETKTHEGKPFKLADREGKGWTVLYFYPKAETPGCTKQACAFRDAIKKIEALNAEVYGISNDTVESQAAFHAHHKLRFTLLADPDSAVIKAFDAKMPIIGMAKRWTFIIDPQLVIRSVNKDVDPAADAIQVAEKLAELQKAK
jgi:peroxiredoxin Q/BCP